MRPREAGKIIALHLGGFRAMHRWRNRNCLTVVMFHRVLPPEAIAQVQPDPLYTATTPFFAEVIAFLQQNYAVVSLDDVLAAQARTRPLPHYALLITFDDGWRDNFQYAQPILETAKVPGVVFVTTDALEGAKCWWQEALLWAVRSGKATLEELWQLAANESGNEASNRAPGDVLSLLLRYGALSPSQRQALLAPFVLSLEHKCSTNQMMVASELRALQTKGIAIGSHGASHLPLTFLKDPHADLQRAADWLNSNVGYSATASISFPHGRYDSRVMAAARQAQYRLLFTSDQVLNPAPGGWLETNLLGRILIAENPVVSSNGRLAKHRLAPWLFLRTHRTLAV